MTTAAAPASSPNTARATRAHVPRAVTTTLPADPAYSLLLQPSEIEPSGFFSTSTGKVPVGRGAPLALIVDTVLPVDRCSSAPGYVGTVASIAATEIAPFAEAGELVRYALCPLLPSAATTVTPALTAFCAATADGSDGVP